MPFETASYFEYTGDGETKPVKPEFNDKTFRAVVGFTRGRNGKEFSVCWQIVRLSQVDCMKALVFGKSSIWRMYTNALVHDGDGKAFDPDSLTSPFIFGGIEAIRNGEMHGEAACDFLLELFDHTEVDMLNESSIFSAEFPKFFKYRKNAFDKRKSKIVRHTLES